MLSHPFGPGIAVGALDGHSCPGSIARTGAGMECSGARFPRHFASQAASGTPTPTTDPDPGMASALILLTGHREAPYLTDYLRGYSDTLPIHHVTDHEDLNGNACPAGC